MKKLLLLSLCFLMLSITQVFAQNRTVTGTVTAKEDGLPMPGVTVKVTGTTIGTQTNSSGKYSLSVPASAKTLTVLFVGYNNLLVNIGSGEVNVALVQKTTELNEVMVVGYGTTTKQAYTGSAKVVSAAEIAKKNVDNVSQALAGEVAGVTVINTSGQPGTTATIRIRGFSSVNGDRDPLYVVDGVPFTGDINSINNNDIETVNVLKDATATSIYGSRGANGVILITTKNGKGKAPYVEAEANFGTNAELIPRYSVITSPEQYAELSWQSLYNQAVIEGITNPANYAGTNLFSNNGLPAAYDIWKDGGDPSKLINKTTGKFNTNINRLYTPESWKDNAFRNSAHQDYNVRLGGSTDKSSYYMSLGYLDDKGYSIASDLQRFSGRVNLTNQVTPWLKAAMNLNYSRTKQNVGGQTQDSGSIFWFVDNIPPIYSVYLHNPTTGAIVPDPIFGGNQYDYGSTGRGFGSLTNSIADTRYNTNRNDGNEVDGNASLNATIIKGLTFENSFGLQYNNNAYVQRDNKFYGSAASQNGSIYLDQTSMTSWDLLDLLRYHINFGNNDFEVLAAHEANKVSTGDFNAFKFNLVQNDLEDLDNAVAGPPASSSNANNELDSYFTQVNYNYKEKYYLTGTIRRDGSSRFINNKWGTFGSVGGAWLISSEDFMKNQTIFSSLKLRASYGLIGEQGGTTLSQALTTSVVSNDGGDGISIGVPLVGNPNLTWESSKHFDAGIEFESGNFLTGTVDYYIKDTRNQIFSKRVGISNGYALLTVNDGRVTNKGLEFDLNAKLVKTKDFRLNLGINGATFKNTIAATPIDPSTGKQQALDVEGIYGYSVGHSMFDFYTKKFSGVDKTNGKSIWNTYWVDLNGDGKPEDGTIEAGGGGEYIQSLAAFQQFVAQNPNMPGIHGKIQQTTTEDYLNATTQYTGQSAIPAVRGAINLTTGYKGFDLSVQLLYSLGGYAYDSAYQTLMSSGTVGGNNWSTDILNAWSKPGQVTNVPRLSNNDDQYGNGTSTRFIEKADYLSLNNVRLSYTFPEASIKKLGVGGLSIWISGDNLILLTHRDGFNPSISEDGSSDIYTYSPLSTLSAGLKVKF